MLFVLSTLSSDSVCSFLYTLWMYLAGQLTLIRYGIDIARNLSICLFSDRVTFQARICCMFQVMYE